MASKLDRRMDATMGRIQSQQLDTGITGALAKSQQMANVGLSGSAKTMATNALARNQAQAVSALRGKKAALQGIGEIEAMGADSALKLAGMEDTALKANQERAMQMGMEVGAKKDELQKSKLEALWNRDMATKERRAKTLSSVISAVGNIAGAYAGKK